MVCFCVLTSVTFFSQNWYLSLPIEMSSYPLKVITFERIRTINCEKLRQITPFRAVQLVRSAVLCSVIVLCANYYTLFHKRFEICQNHFVFLFYMANDLWNWEHKHEGHKAAILLALRVCHFSMSAKVKNKFTFTKKNPKC